MGCLYILLYFRVDLCTADGNAIGIVYCKFCKGAVVNFCTISKRQVLFGNIAEEELLGKTGVEGTCKGVVVYREHNLRVAEAWVVGIRFFDI